ncbi:MAG: hypothetical protein IKJ74_01275 [Clostridia bacterium]|nr:hypothetical protein [Clostridia bacterium]
MKKWIALALTLSMLFPLCACASQEPPTQTAEILTQIEETEEEKKTFVDPWLKPSNKNEGETSEGGGESNVVYDKADQFLPASLAAIPIANSSMSTDELRQICIAFMQLSVSFQWIPDRDVELGNSKLKRFKEGDLQGGLPYINTASGNLYRVLEYYDPETGVIDFSYFADKPDIFGNACSGATGWAWARVINSADIGYTSALNASHGFIPVGPYKYDFSLDRFWQKEDDGTRTNFLETIEVCKTNGEQVMFESYALTKPADCFVNQGHVRMSVEPPVVVRNPDGTIDGEQSYMYQAEQNADNTVDYKRRETADGTEYYIRGNDKLKFTFNELYERGYLPHTFKEFLGTDPVEKAELTVGIGEASVTAKDLLESTLRCNYPISDVFTVIRDAEGNQVGGTFIKRMDNHLSKAKKVSAVTIPTANLKAFAAKGGHTIEIRAQVGTGEILTAYSGTLIG